MPKLGVSIVFVGLQHSPPRQLQITLRPAFEQVFSAKQQKQTNYSLLAGLRARTNSRPRKRKAPQQFCVCDMRPAAP